MRRRHGIAAAALSLAVLAAAAALGSWFMAPDERLGVVHFPVSCGWQSQRQFTTATALLHLFYFAEAEAAFRAVAARDPDCAMAGWGIAMSRLGNPIYALPSQDDMRAARQALAAADAAPTASPRERAYLAAVHTLFDAAPDTGWPERQTAYATAMAEVARDNPGDAEASIFYALALNLAASADQAHANRAKAAELLLLAFAREPDHPGIDHYLTYCLGHSGYQPKPFERAPMISPLQRILLAGFAVLALSGAGAFVVRTAGVTPATTASPTALGGPFALVAADGKPITDRSLRGKWLLVYFGYTHCPSICPMTMTSIAAVLQQLGPLAARVQPVFITIDPERDDEEAVGAFAKAFDARIIGLTGTPAEIAAAAKAYRVFYKKIPHGGPDDYFMEHSSYVFVMDADGHYVTLLTEADLETPADVASRLRPLLAPAT